VKKALLAILISLFSVTATIASPPASIAYDQKKNEQQKKKDPPGPPVVKDKGKQDKPKEPPPRKDKRPD